MSHDPSVIGRTTGDRTVVRSTRRGSTEIRAAYKTTAPIAYVLTEFGGLIASRVTDISDFAAQEVWSPC